MWSGRERWTLKTYKKLEKRLISHENSRFSWSEWRDSFAFFSPCGEENKGVAAVEPGSDQLSTGQLNLDVRVSDSKEIRRNGIKPFLRIGPSGETRTRGILLPKQARYQLRYTRKWKYYDKKLSKQARFLLRCPAVTSPGEAGLCPADRCHSLGSLTPPPAAVASLPNCATPGSQGGIIHEDGKKSNRKIEKKEISSAKVSWHRAA